MQKISSPLVGISVRKSLPGRVRIKTADFEPVATVTWPPIQEQEFVLDRLADILFACDEVIGRLSDDSRVPNENLKAVEQSVRSVYHQINELMKGMVD